MMKQVQLTVRQAITLLILSCVMVVALVTMHRTPIEQLKDVMIDVYVNRESSVKNTNLIIAKIVSSSKDSEKCAKRFNELFMPAVQELNEKYKVYTKENLIVGIEIVILGLEEACK